mmetsp:Transcript_46545/g.120462  ORF Transcript_46545/g.120462 Transcript_46545/m.120462 type:complete len:294 (+) Transcript_46545:11-892(+)
MVVLQRATRHAGRAKDPATSEQNGRALPQEPGIAELAIPQGSAFRHAFPGWQHVVLTLHIFLILALLVDVLILVDGVIELLGVVRHLPLERCVLQEGVEQRNPATSQRRIVGVPVLELVVELLLLLQSHVEQRGPKHEADDEKHDGVAECNLHADAPEHGAQVGRVPLPSVGALLHDAAVRDLQAHEVLGLLLLLRHVPAAGPEVALRRAAGGGDKRLSTSHEADPKENGGTPDLVLWEVPPLQEELGATHRHGRVVGREHREKQGDARDVVRRQRHTLHPEAVEVQQGGEKD